MRSRRQTPREYSRMPLRIAVLVAYGIAVLAGATHLAFHHAVPHCKDAQAHAALWNVPDDTGHHHESAPGKTCAACVTLARAAALTVASVQFEAPEIAIITLPLPSDRPVFSPAHHHIQRGPPRLALQA